MLDMKVTPTALNTLAGVSIYSFRKIVNLLGIEIEDIYIIMLCFIANCLLSSLKKNILATKLQTPPPKKNKFQCFFNSPNGMFREARGSVMPICNMIPLCQGDMAMVEGVVTSGERFKARTHDNPPTTDVKNTWNSYYDSIVSGFLDSA